MKHRDVQKMLGAPPYKWCGGELVEVTKKSNFIIDECKKCFQIVAVEEVVTQ